MTLTSDLLPPSPSSGTADVYYHILFKKCLNPIFLQSWGLNLEPQTNTSKGSSPGLQSLWSMPPRADLTLLPKSLILRRQWPSEWGLQAGDTMFNCLVFVVLRQVHTRQFMLASNSCQSSWLLTGKSTMSSYTNTHIHFTLERPAPTLSQNPSTENLSRVSEQTEWAEYGRGGQQRPRRGPYCGSDTRSLCHLSTVGRLDGHTNRSSNALIQNQTGTKLPSLVSLSHSFVFDRMLSAIESTSVPCDIENLAKFYTI